LSFASALRLELIRLGYSRDLLYQKPTPRPIRQLMVAHGQARRWLNPDYWITQLMGELATLRQNRVRLVVIDDLRFWNEAEALLTYNATLVRVQISGMAADYMIAGVDDGPTETELDTWTDWDAIITADFGDIVTLCHEAGRLVEQW